jgi:membrane-bound lytic murein transglycosylase D
MKTFMRVLVPVLAVMCLLQAERLTAEDRITVQKPYLLQFSTPRSLTFCGERVPLERDDVWERLDRELLLAIGKEAQVVLWLKRSRRYFPFIEEQLRQSRLPDDLKYVVVAESDFYPEAISPKEAAGFWQFIKETGKRFGLISQDHVDERYSLSKSTAAALEYLTALDERFGKWTLALAAYNCGEQRVERELEDQGVKEYFDLDLPPETEQYLFRIFAIKIILSNPAQYGFTLPESEYYRPLDVKEVVVNLPQAVHIRIIAEAAQTTFKNIRDLNPELRGDYVPEGRRKLFIPARNADKFAERLKEKLQPQEQVQEKKQ